MSKTEIRRGQDDDPGKVLFVAEVLARRDSGHAGRRSRPQDAAGTASMCDAATGIAEVITMAETAPGHVANSANPRGPLHPPVRTEIKPQPELRARVPRSPKRPSVPPLPKAEHAPQVVPPAAGHQPDADADVVPPDARALLGAACARILRRTEFADERPVFAVGALRCLTPSRQPGDPLPPGALDRAMKAVAAWVLSECPGLFADDATARASKKLMKHLFGRNLPPFAGHPNERAITRAIELRKLGLKWKEVYPGVIPNHAHLDPVVRRQAEGNLRAAVRSRRNARARRKREGESIA